MIAVLFTAVNQAKADDIVDIAAGNPDFSTLVTAVKAAGLVSTLKGDGPFTVLAPTNAAFAKLKKSLGAKKFNAVLADKKTLTSILTYHVIAGKVMAADVVSMKAGSKAKTVNGASITVNASKKGVYLTGGKKSNKAKVVKTDIVASNGVIHVIDTVLLPPMGKK
ncbi:MAG: fasciclin domain-containing protein [Chthonomonadaceae bacterium]|nr:fasciclin domain-containing protein [Chthonomonadaceae bacterium]